MFKKISLKILAFFILSALLLSSCGAETTGDSSEVQSSLAESSATSETSKDESSLADVSKDESTEDISADNSEEGNVSDNETSEDVSVDTESKTVELYIPDKDKNDLVTVTATFDGTAENLVLELVKAGALPENTEVKSFELKDDTVKIDLSEAFGASVEDGNEDLATRALANTIIKYYDVKQVVFTVEGDVLESGDVRYDSPLGFSGKAMMCKPDDSCMNFKYFETSFDGTADGLVKTLGKAKVFPETVEVISFKIDGNTAKIDLSEEFGLAIATGTLAEGMIVGSLVNSIVLYYNVEQVIFTVEGKVFDSGHVEYDFALGFNGRIQICVPDSSWMNYEYKETTFDGTVGGLIEALAKAKVFPETVKVKDFKIEGNTAKIDLSEDFGLAIATGTLAESMIVSSLVNTLITCYEVEQVYFTVEGSFFDSGHVYYDFPLSFTESL